MKLLKTLAIGIVLFFGYGWSQSAQAQITGSFHCCSKTQNGSFATECSALNNATSCGADSNCLGSVSIVPCLYRVQASGSGNSTPTPTPAVTCPTTPGSWNFPLPLPNGTNLCCKEDPNAISCPRGNNGVELHCKCIKDCH